MYPIATNLTTLGSRYSLIFDINKHNLKHGVLGMFLEHTDQLICGVEAEGIEGSYLPFSNLPNHFQAVYQTLDMNSVTYRGINKDGGYDMAVTFTSPFSPGEEKMNTAPIFYIDVSISRNTRPHNLVKVKRNIEKGILRFGIKGDELTIRNCEQYCSLDYEIETSSRFVLGDFARTLQLKIYNEKEEIKKIPCQERIYSFSGTCNADGIFEIPFSLSNGSFHAKFMMCGFCNIRDFISIHGERYNLLYTSYFQTIEELMEYGIKKYSENKKKSIFVSETITKSSLSQSWKDFIAFTFQSYKLNTVYSTDHAGKKAYHVWEGNCMYNSTMDVEYNDGLFYYTYFPEVLPILLDQWAATENNQGYIDHDQGEGYALSKATYSYPMIIEENCCYLLMLYAHCSIHGNWEPAIKHYSVLKRLVNRIMESDTTGNGIPNEGTSNTIDDAIPAIQNAKEQTYLAIKSACALQCFAKIAEQIGHVQEATAAQERSAQIIQSVDKELWCQDHYGVCTDTSQDGYWRFLTHETLSGDMEGRDSYSIYAENGLLYPLMSGLPVKYLDYDRLKRNISISEEKCSIEFGCNHSNDSDSIWFSQNMWRDFTAAYLGYDMLDNVDKYWEFQKIMNTKDNLNLYIDTYGENGLWYYPRGLTAVGVLFAMLRLQINTAAKEITISPLRRSMKIPLVTFADWKAQRVPWVSVNAGNIVIENEDLLRDYQIVIKP